MVWKKLLEQVIEGDHYLHQNENFLMGDMQVFAELTLLSEVSYYPESMATYRLHDESATRSKDPEKTARFCQSAAEIKLYLCDKHRLPENIRSNAESDWCDSSLRVAFHTRNRELADEVRKKKNKLTSDEWFRYYGSKSSLLNRLFRLAASFRRMLTRKINILDLL